MVDRSPEQEKYAHDETFGMYFVFVLFFLFLFYFLLFFRWLVDGIPSSIRKKKEKTTSQENNQDQSLCLYSFAFLFMNPIREERCNV